MTLLLSPPPSGYSYSFKPLASTQLTPKPPQSLPQSSDPAPRALVIGAGLSGLAAATRLASSNTPFLLIESSDEVGGRVRTDTLNGFLLDRGFQIFITAYPEARSLLDYGALDLRRFYSGARVYYNGGFHTVADPARHFFDSVLSLANPIGTFLDKVLIGLTRLRVLSKTDGEILSAEEVRIVDLLRSIGFSSSIVDRFFRPFFGGIFFDRELETTSRLFDFVFKCLALGDNTLPAKGIGEIPKQLAAKLPTGSILLNTRVKSVISGDGKSPAIVRLENDEILESELGVILAVEQPELDKILAKRTSRPEPSTATKPARSTVCLYFSADNRDIPVSEPLLFLNGSGKGIVNNMFFATNVAPSYAPSGKALVSVSLIGLFEGASNEELSTKVILELGEWFGQSVVDKWHHLRTYRIAFAQPNQSPPTEMRKDPRAAPGLYLCGDHLTSATFDGALVSGRRAAEALLEDRALLRRA